jgi:hypothetical protein
MGSGVPAKRGKQAKKVPAESDTFVRIARSLILASWVQIVQGLIDQAVKGGYQHTKMLLELCGIAKPEEKKTEKQKKTSLSDRLLRGLEMCVDERDKGKDQKHDKGNTH